jgi:cytochrome b
MIENIAPFLVVAAVLVVIYRVVTGNRLPIVGLAIILFVGFIVWGLLAAAVSRFTGWSPEMSMLAVVIVAAGAYLVDRFRG